MVRGLAGAAVLVGIGVGVALIPRSSRQAPVVEKAAAVPPAAPRVEEVPALPAPAPTPAPTPVQPVVAAAAAPVQPAGRELRLRVGSSPPGATVRNGDRILGPTPLDLPFSTSETNPHLSLQLEAEGYEPAAIDVQESNGALTGSATLQRSAASGSHTSRRSGKKSGRPSGYKDDPYQ